MVLPSAYNPLIPQPTDIIAVSQGQILNNFGAIESLIAVDHADFASINAGQHNKVTFPVQAMAPAPVADAVILYSEVSPYTAQPELTYERQAGSDAPTTSVEFTSAGWSSPGWSYLPSGILLKWGQTTVGAAGTWTFTYPVAATIPVFNAVLVEFVSATSNVGVYISASTTTQIQFVTNTGGSFNFLTIGY